MTLTKKLALAQVYGSRVFQRFLEQNKHRLANAARLRQAMFQDLQAGRKPTGYRAEFLESSAKLLIERLLDCAQAFNETHPDDLCSTADFCDVLATARSMLIEAAEAARPRQAAQSEAERPDSN